MLIQIAYSVHHNEEREYSPEVFSLQSKTPTDKELVALMSSVLENSVCHAEWVYDEVVEQFVTDNRQVLIDWLFGTKKIEVTLSSGADEEQPHDLHLFNLPNSKKKRNIGLNTPDGHKGDGLWIEIKQIDDQVDATVSDLLANHTPEQLATMVAVKRFGNLVDTN